MRLSVNLATRPFVELRPLFARLRLAMVLLAVLAVGLGFALRSLSAKAAVAQEEMSALKAKTTQFENERMANESRMRQPQNMAVLERSQFLNAVFAMKSFSWTAVMMDLERVLPAGVQVTSIDPVIAKSGDVTIRLRVSGDRDRSVLLVRNLETSQRFVSPRLVSEQAQTQEGNRNPNAAQLTAPGAVVFDILSDYNPLPERRVAVSAAGKTAKAGTSTPRATPRKRTAKAARGIGLAKKQSAGKLPAQSAVPR